MADSIFGLPLPEGDFGSYDLPTGGIPMGALGSPQKYVEHDPKHQGAAGVGRDILGFLGDFLLTRMHMKPMYQPAQEKRQLSAALSNYDADPLGAIQQATDVDPEYGAKLRNQYGDDARTAAYQGVTSETRQARLAMQQEAAIAKKRMTAAAYINSMGKLPDDQKKETYPALRARALSIYGKDDPELANLLPEEYDPAAVNAFTRSAIPAGQQESLGISQQRADDSYDLGGRRIDESIRHNGAVEDTANQRTGIMRDRANTYATHAGGSGKAKPVMRYPGEDGFYHVQFDDGSEMTSDVKVRPTGKKSVLDSFREGPAAPSSSPPPPRKAGDRIRGPGGVILTSKDGKTWSK